MEKKEILYIHIKGENLPEEGWLQQCFKCDQITSRISLHHTFNKYNTTYEFYVYLCPKCIKKLKNNLTLYEKFNNYCNTYMKTKYNYLFTC